MRRSTSAGVRFATFFRPSMPVGCGCRQCSGSCRRRSGRPGAGVHPSTSDRAAGATGHLRVGSLQPVVHLALKRLHLVDDLGTRPGADRPSDQHGPRAVRSHVDDPEPSTVRRFVCRSTLRRCLVCHPRLPQNRSLLTSLLTSAVLRLPPGCAELQETPANWVCSRRGRWTASAGAERPNPAQVSKKRSLSGFFE